MKPISELSAVLFVSLAGTALGQCTVTKPNYDLIALEGQVAPGGTNGETFASFGPPQIGKLDDVSFVATIGPVGFQRDGLWATLDGVLTPIAIEGDPVPGRPGLIYVDVGADDNEHVHGDDGVIAFVAELEDVNTTVSGGKDGLFVRRLDSTGTAQTVVAEYVVGDDAMLQPTASPDEIVRGVEGIDVGAGGSVGAVVLVTSTGADGRAIEFGASGVRRQIAFGNLSSTPGVTNPTNFFGTSYVSSIAQPVHVASPASLLLRLSLSPL
ncbi:MAG: hypothetical protein AAFR96_10110, partial [Planctomycetota bacterium]